MKSNHKHRAMPGKGKVLPFWGPVSEDQNPAAHGGCMERDYCRCGAIRDTNVNGWHRERGSWYRDEDDDR